MKRRGKVKKIILCFCLVSIIFKILFTGVGFGGISFWFYSITFAGYCLLICLCIKRNLYLDNKLKKLILSLIVFILWVIVVYTINGIVFNIEYVLGFLLIIILIVSLYVSIDTLKQLNLLIDVIIICIFLSSVVAIGQFLDNSLIKQFHDSILVNKEISVGSNRVSGMSTTVISFSYDLIIGITLCFDKIITYKISLKRKLYYICCLSMMLVALLMNQTRSAIIVVGFCIFLLIIKNNSFGRQKVIQISKVFILITFIGVLIFQLSQNFNIGNRFTSKTASSESRIPMIITALNYSLDHPFGTGVYMPSYNYIPEGTSSEVRLIITSNSSHNFLVNILVYYGYIGIFLALYILFQIWRSFTLNKLYLRNINNDLYNLSRTSIIIIIGHSVNGMTHNLGMFNVEITIWVIVIILFINRKLSLFKQEN
jgi:hypothetical protein